MIFVKQLLYRSFFSRNISLFKMCANRNGGKICISIRKEYRQPVLFDYKIHFFITISRFFKLISSLFRKKTFYNKIALEYHINQKFKFVIINYILMALSFCVRWLYLYLNHKQTSPMNGLTSMFSKLQNGTSIPEKLLCTYEDFRILF